PAAAPPASPQNISLETLQIFDPSKSPDSCSAESSGTPWAISPAATELPSAASSRPDIQSDPTPRPISPRCPSPPHSPLCKQLPPATPRTSSANKDIQSIHRPRSSLRHQSPAQTPTQWNDRARNRQTVDPTQTPQPLLHLDRAKSPSHSARDHPSPPP